MVQTIAPVVHGGRRSGWGATVALHTLGAASSAGAFGAALGAVGSVLGAPWGSTGSLLVAGLAFLYAGREVFRVPVPIPDRRRQVPEWWRTAFSPGTAALLYGVGLGIGFLTYVRFGTLVVVSAVAVASADPVTATLVMAPFGLARGLSALVAWAGVSWDGVQDVVDRLGSAAARSVPTMANVMILVVLGVAALGLPNEERSGSALALATSALTLVFGWAALVKILRFPAWRAALRGYALPRTVETVALPLVPMAEATVPLLAMLGQVRGSAALALTLLTMFSVAVTRARRVRGRRLPCGCFGKAKARDYRILLLRNLALGGVALAALVDEPGRPLFAAARWPYMTEALPAALLLLGVCLGSLVVARLVRLHTPGWRMAADPVTPAHEAGVPQASALRSDGEPGALRPSRP
jgi:hypothetical protein